MRNYDLGKLGEDFAAGILEDRGFRILERNYRCPFGEIDIIAEKAGELIFVEVKTRATLRFGRPAEAVTQQKQRRIRRAAGFYMQRERCAGCAGVSFQVIEILYNTIENAF